MTDLRFAWKQNTSQRGLPIIVGLSKVDHPGMGPTTFRIHIEYSVDRDCWCVTATTSESEGRTTHLLLREEDSRSAERAMLKARTVCEKYLAWVNYKMEEATRAIEKVSASG